MPKYTRLTTEYPFIATIVLPKNTTVLYGGPAQSV